MKLEKRSTGAEDAAPAPEVNTPDGTKNKPVVVYIMVLFIVAFLLMALSFLAHQRSNEEVIGTLQSSVSTLQELQKSQDENLRLHSRLENMEKQVRDLEAQVKELEDAGAKSEDKTEALLSLYLLQQQYSAKDYDGCRQTLQSMEDSGQSGLLSKDGLDKIVSPAQRYQQLKEAVMSTW
ncbi:hypothetical protein [Oscillibacter sp.]|uniref:hypothetical protein n=1 Tax=Oscillibacter sp. TaxID=1945593 RepID=UPI0028AD8D12|nr:hypothetical protein [Oscillibacter sp.]